MLIPSSSACQRVPLTQLRALCESGNLFRPPFWRDSRHQQVIKRATALFFGGPAKSRAHVRRSAFSEKVKSGTAGSLNMRFRLPERGVSFTTAHVCRLRPVGRDLDCRALRLRVCRRRELLLVILVFLVFGGIDATHFLHRCISCTDRVVCAGPEPRFLLVLLALPAARILCGTTCRRDIL